MKISVFLLLAAAAAASSGCAAGPAKARRAMSDPASILAKADLDRDGRITRAEFTVARGDMFDRLDRNDDGYATAADAPRRRRRGSGSGGERLDQLRQALDVDRDGRISRREFVEAPGLGFERADADQNDVIDRAELDAFRRAVAERREER